VDRLDPLIERAKESPYPEGQLGNNQCYRSFSGARSDWFGSLSIITQSPLPTDGLESADRISEWATDYCISLDMLATIRR